MLIMCVSSKIRYQQPIRNYKCSVPSLKCTIMFSFMTLNHDTLHIHKILITHETPSFETHSETV